MKIPKGLVCLSGKWDGSREITVLEFPLWLSRLTTQLISMRMWVWSLASFSGSKDPALLQAVA